LLWSRGGIFVLVLCFVGESETASNDDFVAYGETIEDLYPVFCANADLDILDGGVIVGASEDHVVRTFFAFVESGGGNGQRILCGARGHLNLRSHSRSQ